MKNKKQQSERFYLFWCDENLKRQVPAGVAFYQDEYGEYRLKIDVISDDKTFYVRATGVQGETATYRVETAIKRNGKFSHRSLIGSGFRNKETNNDIVMDIGPFARKLVLSFGNN